MKSIEIDISTLDFTKPISFYSNLYGLSPNAMKNRFVRLDVYKNFKFVGDTKTSIKLKILRKSKYEDSPKRCKHCNEIIQYEKKKSTFCSLSCSTSFSLKSRKNSISDKGIEKLRKSAKDRWLNGEYDSLLKPKIHLNCIRCGNEFHVHNCENKRKFCSRKCSSVGKDNSKCGGYREICGKGHHGRYKGYFCNSSWELAWVIYSLDHGLKFKRNVQGFPYEYEGKTYKYYPDFYIEDSENYLEIKGQITEKWKAKLKNFPHKIDVLYYSEMKPILKYVVEKYGKDFVRLYDK